MNKSSFVAITESKFFCFSLFFVVVYNGTVQGKELVLSTGTGFAGDSGCGFAVRERRRHSLRRRRSGGPELFASAARRGLLVVTLASAVSLEYLQNGFN